MARSRSKGSRFLETPSKTALRGKHPVGKRDQETGPSSRAKRRIQGREAAAHPAGRPLASERTVLPVRRKTPTTATQPRSVAARAEAVRLAARSLRRQGR